MMNPFFFFLICELVKNWLKGERTIKSIIYINKNIKNWFHILETWIEEMRMVFVSELAKASLNVLTSINSVQTFRNTDDRICRPILATSILLQQNISWIKDCSQEEAIINAGKKNCTKNACWTIDTETVFGHCFIGSQGAPDGFVCDDQCC